MARHVMPPGGSLRGVFDILFVAKGTKAELRQGAATWPVNQVSKATIEISYFHYDQGVSMNPGIREDFLFTRPDGSQQREIEVAADGAAWNEAVPGGNATSAMNAAAERMTRIWMTPDGVIWAALTADGKSLAEGVTLSSVGGARVLSIPVNGTTMKVTFGADNRPARVEAAIKSAEVGDALCEMDYSDYRDFENAYGIYFPSHIVEKFNGRTVLDLTVTEFHTNPYVVFPEPSEIASAAKKPLK